MKKLAIVLAALLLASVFVGCNPSLTIPGSTWKQDGGDGSFAVWTFEEDGTLVYDYFDKEGKKVDVWSGKGAWALADDSILVVVGLKGIVGEYRVEVGVNKLSLYKGDVEEPTIILERYKA